MNEQEEHEAMWQVAQTFKAAKEAKAALGSKLKNIGLTLVKFGGTLEGIDRHIFAVSDTTVNVHVRDANRAGFSHPVALLSQGQFDWKDLCETLRSYTKACEDKDQSAAALKQMGLEDI